VIYRWRPWRIGSGHPREAQLAIRDAGRAKEADLPLAVPEPIGRNARRDHRYRAQIYPNATSRDGFWCSFSPLEGRCQVTNEGTFSDEDS
jgi:hypothetical protein